MLSLQVYYHNTQSGESSWVKPKDFQGDAASAKGQPMPVSSADVQVSQGLFWVVQGPCPLCRPAMLSRIASRGRSAHLICALAGWQSWSSFTARPCPVNVRHSTLFSALQGTDWAEVSCSDGKVYYYNSANSEVTWQKPQIVADAQAKGERQEQQAKRSGMTPAHAAIIARLKASNAPALNLRPDLRGVLAGPPCQRCVSLGAVCNMPG